MDSKTIFSKTAKGLKEVSGTTSNLSRGLRNILKEIDGKSTLADLQGKLRKLSEADLKQALNDLADNGYIRDPAQEGGGPAVSMPQSVQKPVAQKPAPAAAGEDLDFMSMLGQPAAKAEAPPPKKPADDQAAAQAARAAAEAKARKEAEEKARREAEEKAKQEALLKARREAEEKVKRVMAERARLEAEARAKKEAEEKVRREAEEKLRREAEEKAKKEAEERARHEAQEKVRLEAEARVRQEAEQKVRREAEEKAKREAEEQARREAEEKARREAEEKVRREAEEKLRREAEEKARLEAEARARQEAEEKARREAEEKARHEDEERARREAEEKARREAEEKARREVEEKARREAEEKIRREAEEKSRKEAEEKLRRETEEKERREAEENARREAEEKAKREAEARAKKEADEKLRREAEEKTRRDTEERIKREAEEKVRREAEAKLQREAEERVSREFEESMRREAEAQAQREAEEKARREAEEKTKREEEEKARREAEEKARREAEEKARLEAEERVRREAEEKVRREIEEKARQEAEEKARREAEEKARKESEEKARQDAEAMARREAEERARRETEEKARRKAEEKRAAKMERAANLGQIKWGKIITTGLVLVLAAGLGLIHVISFDGKIPQLEQTATAQFQQPVKIESVHLSLFPPHWRIEGVSIGKEGQIKAPRVKAMIELSGLFGEAKSFSMVEFDSPVVSEEGLRWITLGRPQGSGFKVDKVRAVNARLDSSGIDLPAFSIKGDIAADGNWQKMSIESTDRGVFMELAPQGDRVRFELNADSFKMPFGSTLELGAFNAKGTFDGHEMAVTEFVGSVYGGTLSGNAMLRWATNWSLEGTLNAKQVDGKQFVPGLLESGRIDGRASYVMQARDAKTLFAAPHVEGNYSIGQGALLGVDLTYLLQNGSNSGRTAFRELVGSSVSDGGNTQLKQLRLDAGILSSNGSAEVDVNNNIRGRFATVYRFDNQQTRGNLVLSGTVSAPKFSR